MEKNPLPKHQDTKGWRSGSGGRAGCQRAEKNRLDETVGMRRRRREPRDHGGATAGCPRRPRPRPYTHRDCKRDQTPRGCLAVGRPLISVPVCPSCRHSTGCPDGTAPCPYTCHGVGSCKGRGLQHPPRTQHPTNAAIAHLHVGNRFPMGTRVQHEPSCWDCNPYGHPHIRVRSHMGT